MSARIPASVVVMTKNEERNLAACLRSVERFAQVLVVDSASTDRTCEIAREHGAEVVQFEWSGGYPKKKQWCLEQLPFTQDWVLYLDADERLTAVAADEIAALLAGTPEHAAYFAALDYVFLGRVLRYGHRFLKLVLLDRRRARFLDYPDLEATNMWEVEGHYQPAIDGTTGALRGRILHEDHDSLFHYFERHNRYSDWEAVLRSQGLLRSREEAQPRGRRIAKAVFDRVPLKGAAAFAHSDVVKLGFLDGRAGLHYALARAFYYWQIALKTRDLRRADA